MINCNDPRKTCGEIVSTSCSPFVGRKPDFVADEDFPCDVNATDIIDLTTAEVDRINSDNDLTELNKRCLDFVPATVKNKELHQVEIDKICALDSTVTALQDTINDLNIGAELVQVDLGDMTPAPNPCSPGTDLYTLHYLLQTFADAINAINTNLGI